MLEPIVWDVGDPESKRDEVDRARRPPAEQIGLNERNGIVAGTGAVDREHLRRGVNGGERTRGLGEYPGPQTGPCGKLEDIAVRGKAPERSSTRRHSASQRSRC